VAGRNADGGVGVSDVVDANPAELGFLAGLVVNTATQVSWVERFAFLVDENPFRHLSPGQPIDGGQEHKGVAELAATPFIFQITVSSLLPRV